MKYRVVVLPNEKVGQMYMLVVAAKLGVARPGQRAFAPGQFDPQLS